MIFTSVIVVSSNDRTYYKEARRHQNQSKDSKFIDYLTAYQTIALYSLNIKMGVGSVLYYIIHFQELRSIIQWLVKPNGHQ